MRAKKNTNDIYITKNAEEKKKHFPKKNPRFFKSLDVKFLHFFFYQRVLIESVTLRKSCRTRRLIKYASIQFSQRESKVRKSFYLKNFY